METKKNEAARMALEELILAAETVVEADELQALETRMVYALARATRAGRAALAASEARAKQERALDELAAEAQRLGLYDEPRRPAAERDVLDDLSRAAAAKWRGDPAAQQWGLFARAAAEIKRLRNEAAERERLGERWRAAGLMAEEALAHVVGGEPLHTRELAALQALRALLEAQQSDSPRRKD